MIDLKRCDTGLTLFLSTGHVSEATMTDLCERALDYPYTCAPHEYGVVLTLPDAGDAVEIDYFLAEIDDHFDLDLWKLVKTGIESGVRVLVLDSAAPAVDDLPVYEW